MTFLVVSELNILEIWIIIVVRPVTLFQHANCINDHDPVIFTKMYSFLKFLCCSCIFLGVVLV